MRHSRRAEQERTRRNILRDARLRHDDGLVTNGQMAGKANLPGNRDVITDDRAASDAGKPADDAVFADDAVVTDLNEIIDLRPLPNPRRSEAGTVDGGVHANLDIIPNLDIAELRNLLVYAVHHFKTK